MYIRIRSVLYEVSTRVGFQYDSFVLVYDMAPNCELRLGESAGNLVRWGSTVLGLSSPGAGGKGKEKERSLEQGCHAGVHAAGEG